MIDNLKLKNKVKELCADKRFVHHKWFYEHHLSLVERLVDELKSFYPGARTQILDSLVWFHDLEKIVRNQQLEPKSILLELGFDSKEIEELNRLCEIEGNHRELDLNNSEIEVKILSSADGAAHLLGPFFSIYWYENPEKSIEDLTNGDLEKMNRDWERKMVLPEIKKYFESRRQLMLEQRGIYPEKFLQ